MSLFKTRSWWATTAGLEEFHDNRSLAVGNVDNSVDGSGTVEIMICPPKKACVIFRFLSTILSDKLVVGSYQGLLRIYAPQEGGYLPAHTMLEKQVDPIVQIAIGKFATYVCNRILCCVCGPVTLSLELRVSCTLPCFIRVNSLCTLWAGYKTSKERNIT